MFFCQRITQSGKIVIFVYQTDIDACRTWMTVFAVYAFSLVSSGGRVLMIE